MSALNARLSRLESREEFQQPTALSEAERSQRLASLTGQAMWDGWDGQPCAQTQLPELMRRVVDLTPSERASALAALFARAQERRTAAEEKP